MAASSYTEEAFVNTAQREYEVTGRRKLLHASTEEFAEKGFHGSSVRGIAERAGLSLAALYYYFSGKEEVLQTLVEDSLNEYTQSCTDALREAGPNPMMRLAALVSTTVGYNTARQTESRIVGREWTYLPPELRGKLESHRNEVFALFDDAIRTGIEQGVFRVRYPIETRRGILAMCNSIADWYNPRGPLSVDQLARRHIDIALAMAGHQADEDAEGPAPHAGNGQLSSPA